MADHDLSRRRRRLRAPRQVEASIERLADGTTMETPPPAWLRPTPRESRLWVTTAVLVAIGLQLAVPDRLAIRHRWILPALEGVLLVGLWVANSTASKVDRSFRLPSMLLIGAVSIGNAYSAARLIDELIRGTAPAGAGALLGVGAAIWLTNVIVFSLWYWELDRGGPVARAAAREIYPDFLFPQMDDPALAPPDWEPLYADYLYVSFTNAAAFSPTDVLPLSRWAKMLMMVQSAVSLTTAALVIARAVNILK